MTIKGQLWDPVVTELYQYVNSLLLTVKSGRVFFFFLLNHIGLFATPWTVAPQAPLSMVFPRQEYWSALPLPSPEGAS